jgi:hypothetical protein
VKDFVKSNEKVGKSRSEKIRRYRNKMIPTKISKISFVVLKIFSTK